MFEAVDMAMRSQKTRKETLTFKKAKGFVETHTKRYVCAARNAHTVQATNRFVVRCGSTCVLKDSTLWT